LKTNYDTTCENSDRSFVGQPGCHPGDVVCGPSGLDASLGENRINGNSDRKLIEWVSAHWPIQESDQELCRNCRSFADRKNLLVRHAPQIKQISPSQTKLLKGIIRAGRRCTRWQASCFA